METNLIDIVSIYYKLTIITSQSGIVKNYQFDERLILTKNLIRTRKQVQYNIV